MNYFLNCTTPEQRKVRWKELAKVHHPDLGGDTVVMQEINRQYQTQSKIAFSGMHQEFNSETEEVEPRVSIWKKTNTNPFNSGSLKDFRKTRSSQAMEDLFREMEKEFK